MLPWHLAGYRFVVPLGTMLLHKIVHVYTHTHTKRPLTQGYPEDLRVKVSLRDIQSENSHGCGREW